MSNNLLIVGGNFGYVVNKPSLVIDKLVSSLSVYFKDITVINSGTLKQLQESANMVGQFDITVWMPDVPDNAPNIKMEKDIGAVLIVAKNLYSNKCTRTDAVTRIFKYHANAVIAINRTSIGEPFNFELIDALNNNWTDHKTTLIDELTASIHNLYHWTKAAKRESVIHETDDIDKLLELNTKVINTNAEQNIRYFGNTRCTLMFPSCRQTKGILVSPRNSDKLQLKRNDMIHVYRKKLGQLAYFGNTKPSIDTPIQMSLYEYFPRINFFIHGHNTIKKVHTTKRYFPCGDLREIQQSFDIINTNPMESTHVYSGMFNIKNHGFLIYAENIADLTFLVNKAEFK